MNKVVKAGITTVVVVVMALVGYFADALAAAQFLFSDSFHEWTKIHGYTIFWIGVAFAVAAISLGVWILRLKASIDDSLKAARENEAAIRSECKVEIEQLRQENKKLEDRLRGPDGRDVELQRQLVADLRPTFVANELRSWRPESSRMDSLRELESFRLRWSTDATLHFVDQNIEGSLVDLLTAIGEFEAACNSYLDMNPDFPAMQRVPPASAFLSNEERSARIDELSMKRDSVTQAYDDHFANARRHGL